jgi:hypothetical protein
MARLELTPTSLVVHVTGLDRILTLHSRLEIPREHIVSVTYDPQEAQREFDSFWRETYVPGAHRPGGALAGTFVEHGERIFWDVHHPQKTVIITLAHEQFNKIIVEVEDPQRVAQSIQEQLQALA